MRLAIIGATGSQQKICEKAKAMGVETIGFAWEQGAICKDLFDKFYPISIYEKDQIVEICRKEKIDGVVSNASEKTVEIVAYIAEALGLRGGPFSTIKKIQDKSATREISNHIQGLTPLPFYKYDGRINTIYPCVVKPCSAAGKAGVSFVHNEQEYNYAIKEALAASNGDITVEAFAEGDEISVESISFDKKHYVIQITDKQNTGAPHFVEIGHHQPSAQPQNIQDKIRTIIPKLLDAVHFENGATHIELKIGPQGEIFLIEINPRGGGDEISNILVEQSTDCDYVKKMIEVALGTFTPPTVHNTAYAGIYFLCKQTAQWLHFFETAEQNPWHFFKYVAKEGLTEATGNSNRNGYIIYKSDKKVEPYCEDPQ